MCCWFTLESPIWVDSYRYQQHFDGEIRKEKKVKISLNYLSDCFLSVSFLILQECVHHGNLFKNYDKTYEGCKRKADVYRKANIPGEEVQKMDKYFDEVNSRWKKVSVEIKSVQSMLEEVIESWRRYNACVDLLTVWLSNGERVISKSPEEKQVKIIRFLFDRFRHLLMEALIGFQYIAWHYLAKTF